MKHKCIDINYMLIPVFQYGKSWTLLHCKTEQSSQLLTSICRLVMNADSHGYCILVAKVPQSALLCNGFLQNDKHLLSRFQLKTAFSLMWYFISGKLSVY